MDALPATSFASHPRRIIQVLFPRNGCEQLLAQLFNFGVEGRDDLEWTRSSTSFLGWWSRALNCRRSLD
jgi:hypothetical protein